MIRRSSGYLRCILSLPECAINEKQFSIAAGYIQKVRQARQILGVIPISNYANEIEAWEMY